MIIIVYNDELVSKLIDVYFCFLSDELETLEYNNSTQCVNMHVYGESIY